MPTDTVVLEACGNTWAIYDLLEPLVARVVVADPLRVRLIAASPVKTDRRDTLTLARLLVVNLLPVVWVPSKPVREVRALVAHRRQLVRQRTAAKNRLPSVVLRNKLHPPAGDLWSQAQDAWWEAQGLSLAEQLRVTQDLEPIRYLSKQIAQVETVLAQLSVQEPWAEAVPFLIQLPGVGLVTAMTILAAVGEIQRFPSAKQLVGYSGLGASIHASGQTNRSGGITRQGRQDLRTVLVEAAWVAVQRSRVWQARFERLAHRIGRSKAIVAIARKLLVVMWYLLTQKGADRAAEPLAVARRFLRWGSRSGAVARAGQSRGSFVRHQLDRIGVGGELTELQDGPRLIRLTAAPGYPGARRRY